MIEFTIKTLDSINHQFKVNDEMTVEQLKDQVRDRMGIALHMQRLIFCGRVMQDDKKLSEYGVNGKVVHLVQRAPPSPQSRQNARSRGAANNPGVSEEASIQQQIRRLMALNTTPDFVIEHHQSMTLSPTSGRIEFIRRIINEIKASLVRLRSHIARIDEENTDEAASSEAPIEPMENEPAPGAPQEEGQNQQHHHQTEYEFALDGPARNAQNARRRVMRHLRARHPRPRDLGQLIEELDLLHEQFTPMRTTYIQMLLDANEPQPPVYTDYERDRHQLTADMVCDVMHSFAHAYHAISDIFFEVGQRTPRLSSEPLTARHPVPVQAHINVVQANRRQNQAAGRGNASSTQSSDNSSPPPDEHMDADDLEGGDSLDDSQDTSSSTPTLSTHRDVETRSQTTAEDTDQDSPSASAPTAANPQAGRNSTQPTVNINIQPDPVTYQVEIATRVPIAFGVEPVINGITTVTHTPANTQPQPQQNQRNQTPNQGAQQNQANRRQVLLDIENLFRGIGAASSLGGVEVVMSMEEIPQDGNVATAGGSNAGYGAGATAVNARPGAAAAASGNSSTVPIVLGFPSNAGGVRSGTGTGTGTGVGAGTGTGTGVGTGTGTGTATGTGAGTGTGTGTAASAGSGTDTGNDSGVRVSAGVAASVAAAATAAAAAAAAAVTNPHGIPGMMGFPADAGVILTPMSWGTPPNSDLLQNIVSSVLRQGLVTGVEGIAIVSGPLGSIQTHYQPASQNQAQGARGQAQAPQAQGTQNAQNTQNLRSAQSAQRAQRAQSSQSAQRAQGAQSAQSGSSAQSAPSAPSAQSSQSARGAQSALGAQSAQGAQSTRSGPSTQSAQTTQNMPYTQPRQPYNLQLRRPATGTRTHPVSMACLIYDRFLHCDSNHARRRLQRRREIHQEQLETQERLRIMRETTLHIESMGGRHSNMTQDNVNVMLRLLNGPPSNDAWLTAFMTAVARQLFLADPLNANYGEPVMMPNEFQAIRFLLRNYVQTLLDRAGTDANSYAFDSVADLLIQQHQGLINTMNSVTPIQSHINVVESFRALLRSRLPSIVATVMSNSNSEMYTTRFYGVFARFFNDMCTLITFCCEDGVDGLREIYDTYMESILEHFQPAVQDMLRILCIENICGIVNDLTSNFNTIRPFIRRHDGVMPDYYDLSSMPARQVAAAPMEVSTPSPPALEEPMRTSPSPPCDAAAEVEPEDVESEVENASAPANTIVEEAAAYPIFASTSTASPRPRTNADAAEEPQASNSSQNRHSPRTSKTNRTETPTTSSSRNSPDSNVRFVPPVVIVQHWDEEWVPVFTRDQQNQMAEPQEPYSDAYLSGMPSRKRRCVRQSRPQTTLDGFMNESVREASERTSTSDNGPVRNALREHMRSLARTRASSSEDYDPLRYTSAARFLNPPKSNIQEPPENSEPKDNSEPLS